MRIEVTGFSSYNKICEQNEHFSVINFVFHVMLNSVSAGQLLQPRLELAT